VTEISSATEINATETSSATEISVTELAAQPAKKGHNEWL
jgi:hypothetical protein